MNKLLWRCWNGSTENWEEKDVIVNSSSQLIFPYLVIISIVRRILKESISLNEINEWYYLFNLNNFNQTKRRGRLNWQMLSGEIDSFKNDNQEGSIS